MLAKKRKPSKKTEASFLEKLYDILSNDDDYSQYIHWSPDGSCIVISDPNGLTRNVLPKFYKHHNFSSFVRQLNLYNFKKVKNTGKGQKREKEERYKHKEFNERINQKDIKSIKKVKNDTPEKSSLKNSNIPNEDPEYVKKIEELEQLDEVSKVKEYKNILNSEELTNLTNVKILNYLINKSKENSDNKRLIQNGICNLTKENNNIIEKLELLKGKIEEQKKPSMKMKSMVMLLSLLNCKNIRNKVNLDIDNINDFENKVESYKKKIDDEIKKINPFDDIETYSEEVIEKVPEVYNINPLPPPSKPSIPNFITFIPYNQYTLPYLSNAFSIGSKISVESISQNFINYGNVKNIERYSSDLQQKQSKNNSIALTNNNNITNQFKIQDSIFLAENQSTPIIFKQGYLYIKNNLSQYEKRLIIIDSTPKLIFIHPENIIKESEIFLEKSFKVVYVNKNEFELVTKDRIYKFKDNEGNSIIWKKTIENIINIYSK